MNEDKRIPIEHFADFVRCTIYRDSADPTAGVTASLRYEAFNEAFDASLKEKVQAHARGEVHHNDKRDGFI